jgi:hypothetical protein
MRTSILLFSLLILVTPALADDSGHYPSVELDGDLMLLASVESGPDAVVNVYVRTHQTLKNWNVLFTAHYVRSAKSVDEAVLGWNAQARNPATTINEKEDSSAQDRRFKMVIRSPNNDYLEYDELRFIPSPNGKGVIYYQAAVRMNPANKVDKYRAGLKQLGQAHGLKSLTLEVIEKMPAQPE